MGKIAILQVADTGPLESLVIMLRSAGYECYICSESLRGELITAGCDTVVSLRGLVENWGYEYPSLTIKEASVEMMRMADLYVDVKAHRNMPKVIAKWPNLKGKILWYRINGGTPEHVKRTREGRYEDMGNEMEPGCPIVTPNMWYHPRNSRVCSQCDWIHPPGLMLFTGACPRCGCTQRTNKPWYRDGMAYVMWPPFHGIERYDSPRSQRYDYPICLVHNINGWGYADIVSGMRSLGVKIYGRGSHDGLLPHIRVPATLSTALAMVHLKSSDAPGYALYEGLAAGCPLIVTRRLIWRNKMEELLIPGKTCLVFDRKTHDPLSGEDVMHCIEEVSQHLLSLRDVARNEEIGQAGKMRLRELMWDVCNDGQSFKDFMVKHFEE